VFKGIYLFKRQTNEKQTKLKLRQRKANFKNEKLSKDKETGEGLVVDKAEKKHSTCSVRLEVERTVSEITT